MSLLTNGVLLATPTNGVNKMVLTLDRLPNFLELKLRNQGLIRARVLIEDGKLIVEGMTRTRLDNKKVVEIAKKAAEEFNLKLALDVPIR